MKQRNVSIAIGFIVSIAAFWYFLSGVDWNALWDQLKQIQSFWIVVASSILLLEFVIRAWRWQILLRPTGQNHKIWDLFIAQLIGATCNTLLPLRAGEIAKPLVAARRTKTALVTVAATSIMERVYDILGMVSVLVLMLLVATPNVDGLKTHASNVYNAEPQTDQKTEQRDNVINTEEKSQSTPKTEQKEKELLKPNVSKASESESTAQGTLAPKASTASQQFEESKRDSEALENQALVFKLQLYGGMFGVFAALCMGVFFYLASRKNAARDTFRKCLFLAPPPIQNKFMELFDGFVAGLSNAKDRKGFWQAAALSIWMWCNGSLAIYCLFQAFSMSLPFGAACFVSVAIALTVALPQAPGFIGVFHVAMEKTMLLWGQEAASAQGFALIFWGVSFIPVTVIGLFALWSEGIALSDLKISKAVMPENGKKNEHSTNH